MVWSVWKQALRARCFDCAIAPLNMTVSVYALAHTDSAGRQYDEVRSVPVLSSSSAAKDQARANNGMSYIVRLR
jgi:hypothetical protein